MSDISPPLPLGSTIRQNADGTWSYRVGPHAWRPMPAPLTAAPWVSPLVASIPMERLDAQALAVQLEEDGKYLMASAMANECPKTRDLAVRVIRAAVLLAGGWEGERLAPSQPPASNTAAQAVLNAFDRCGDNWPQALAAALYAAAHHLSHDRRQLAAIATELEGHHG